MSNRLSVALILLSLGWSVSAGPNDWRAGQALSELVYYPQRLAPATVVSLNETVVSAQLDAVVKEFPAQVGDHVRRGERLLKLDCAEYEIQLRATRAQLQSAEARLRLAENQYIRAEKLLDQQLTSQEDLDARQANRDALAADLKAAEAERDRAGLLVERCDIRAPFDALVTERLVANGQLASVGTPLITLIDQQSIELSAQVGADDAALLGRVTNLHFNNGRLWPVKIRSVVAAIDPATRNREVRLTFTAETPLPGAAGKLAWRDPRPFLPARFIVKRGERLGLFIAAQDKAKFIVLADAQPGRDHPLDLPPDTRILTAELPALQDGASLAAGSFGK